MVPKKLGRNEPCWCGSGKKYKHCHENRHREKPYESHEIESTQKKFSHAKYCLHPKAQFKECSGGISNAHTIQRNGGLNLIARNGHVYGILPGYLRFIKYSRIVPDLIGVRKASSFTGFCNFHDTKTFEPIERNPFQSNEHHAFLLAYRAMCKELYNIKCLKEILPFYSTLDRGYDLKLQMLIQREHSSLANGVELKLKSLEKNKFDYDQALCNDNFSQVKFYVLRLASPPDLMCSDVITPDFDFNGNKLRNVLSPESIDYLTLSIIATDQGGAIIFSWLNEKSDSCTRLINSLASLSDNDLPHAVVRFVYSYVANVYSSPDWWENLSVEDKDNLEDRMLSGLGISKIHRKDCLLDDLRRLVSWKIISREANL